MTYRVKIHRQVEKALQCLSEAHYRKFLEYEPIPRQKFDIIKLDRTEDLDIYRVRLDDYRVIHSVNWKNKVIKILKLKSRGKAYK